VEKLIDLRKKRGDISMIFKRRIYLLAIVLTMFIAALVIAFVVQKDSKDEFKGTLVEMCRDEAVV